MNIPHINKKDNVIFGSTLGIHLRSICHMINQVYDRNHNSVTCIADVCHDISVFIYAHI